MRPLPARSIATQPALAQAAQLTLATPGDRQWEGPQQANVVLSKRAPEEVQVGQATSFTLLVRNIGSAPAHDVVVLDRVPRGMRLMQTKPQAEQGGDGTVVWNLGELAAGQDVTLAMELIPETEGELGSVATLSFASRASVRTICTQPRLEISAQCERQVLIGETAHLVVKVTNIGTGVARHVRLEEDVPQGLRHPLGPAMDLDLEDLAPGLSKTIPLDLMAAEPGPIANRIRALATNAEPVETLTELEVIAPKLVVVASGPRLRYLERQATYQITIQNQGTAVARNVALTAFLPRGLQFNSAGNHGSYIPTQHAVQWELEELPAKQSATTELTVLPVEEGDFVLRLQCTADGVRTDPIEKAVRVEGQSELAFSIEDDNDPVETDGQTVYTIRVTNNGSRVDRNIQLTLELPAAGRVLQVSAPIAYQQRGNTLEFEPIAQMKAKDQETFRVSVALGQEGTQVMRAQIKSELRPTAVIQEESTKVYSDQ
jgi:uncharacterized repeat protein (TIGR01451 family)